MQKVKRNGQVTIPLSIREAINLSDGDYVRVELRENSHEIVFKQLEIRDKEPTPA